MSDTWHEHDIISENSLSQINHRVFTFVFIFGQILLIFGENLFRINVQIMRIQNGKWLFVIISTSILRRLSPNLKCIWPKISTKMQIPRSLGYKQLFPIMLKITYPKGLTGFVFFAYFWSYALQIWCEQEKSYKPEISPIHPADIG